MKTLVAFPSTAIFGQEAARAFDEVGGLEAYFTSFAHCRSGPLARILPVVPRGRSILTQLERRAITALPDDKIETRPLLEILYTAAASGGARTRTVDRIWDYLSKDFTRAAARRIARGGVGAVYAYEYSALEAFEAADRLGIAKILDFPSLNSRQFETLQRAQKEIYPELRTPDDAYFEALFETRQARRDAEMRAADVIITNSSLTRASHIAGGADPKKTFAVPYGAPAPLEAVTAAPDPHGPLRVIWAGTFSIRKAAHLFAEAWRGNMDPAHARADIFGAIGLPDRLWKPAPEGMTFHGSVVRPVLFDAFQASDVLMFPTLSDGFGMVVTEAFARGLPVITTDQAGASDLVRHGVNGLIIEAGNAQAIADALCWCLDNRTALAGMREAALETARGWQWSEYRSALRGAVAEGLRRCGQETDPQDWRN
ncbi:glycosyltransferase [Silicimonas algicola]|uniref:Glycosyl transferase family 1 n=1 Tax=Silicimonas algicola TaxID=1826607 RepID=A0A316FXK8_9RHOB|nr:glycosyltransferase family 4 protein [Silicimonas algicola]AZQ66753.1 glycosyltransferase [Silicimonas algicola]PWK53133.1 glycosyl transferase family 1 [Silicimonas algicola]